MKHLEITLARLNVKVSINRLLFRLKSEKMSDEKRTNIENEVNDLVQMGYRVGWACYGAKDVGAVHRRERVFIVANSKSKSSNGGGLAKQLCPESQAQEFGGRTWQRISGGNWREWDTCPIVYETRSEPRVRRANDGLPHRVDRLKCLGNAVVPQQVFPILEEIARQIKCV